MSRIYAASCYRFVHSRTVHCFFLVFILFALLSLTSGWNTVLDLFASNSMDMIIPAFGLSIFSGLYVGGEFRSRTLQNEISQGKKRLNLLTSRFLLLLLVQFFLVLLYAALPAACLFLQKGEIGAVYGFETFTQYPQYILRLLLPGTLFTLARSAGLFVLPFLFRDTVKTILSSLAYTLLVSGLTQRNSLEFPYRYYRPEAFSIGTDLMMTALSLVMLAAAFGAAFLCFHRAALK